MKMFKTHHKKMLLRGVADLQRIAQRLRMENEQLINELNQAHSEMIDLQHQVRYLELKVKIKTQSEQRLRGGH